MSTEARIGGFNIASFVERTGDPGAVANRVRLYSKDDAGTANLYAQDSAGTVSLINIGLNPTFVSASFTSGGASNPQVRSGTADPSAGGGVAAPEGSIYMRFVGAAGEAWLKTGVVDTAWIQILAGSITMQSAYDGGAAIAVVAGTPVDAAIDAAGEVYSDGLLLSNDELATTILHQYPPTLRMSGQWWDSVNSQQLEVEQRVEAQVAGGTAYPILAWYNRQDGGAWSRIFSIHAVNGVSQIHTLATNYWSFGGISTSHGFTDDNDVVCSRMEVDSGLFCDGPIGATFSGRLNMSAGSEILLGDNIELRIGVGFDTELDWSTVQTNDHLVWGMGNTSKLLLLCDNADNGNNFGIANQANPTIAVASAAAGAGEWGGWQHDGTDLIPVVGTGGLTVPIDLSHTGTNLGFYSTAPIVQQAGVVVSAAGIHAALVALGLFTA